MMMKKKNGKFKIITLIISLIFTLTMVTPAFAVELSDEQKATLDQSVNKLKKEQSTVNDTKMKISEIEAKLWEYQNTIDALDARMAETKDQIAQLQAQEQQQEADFASRVGAMYMLSEDGVLEFVFTSKDFAELLTRIDWVRTVMQSDRDCINGIIKTRKEIEASIEGLEADKANAQALKADQDLLLANYEALLSTQMLQYDAEKAEADRLAQSMGLGSIDEYISDVEWPFDQGMSTAFHISDWFGPRNSPGGFGSSDHKGIDIIPGAGTPIMAIASGVVKVAEYNGGYGNNVVIEHGKNNDGVTISSLYGHMSSYIVSVGQRVSQGEVIGYVGSTGPSTGAHLHLEIWENTVQVNPMGPSYFERYLPRCSFYG